MKKIFLAIAALSLLGLASCDGKSCRCYDLVGSRWTGPSTTSTLAGTRCSELNTTRRVCNEMDDPILNPDDIGVDTKKK